MANPYDLPAVEIGSAINENVTTENEHDSTFKNLFQTRNSLITELWDTNKYLRLTYRIFCIAFFIVYIKAVLAEAIDGRESFYGTKYILIGLSDIPIALGIWLFMFIMTLLVAPSFNLWASKRHDFIRNGVNTQIFDTFCLLMYLGYCITIIVFPINFRAIKSALACNFIIAVSQIIFIMKTYAFIRSNVPKAKSYTDSVLPGIAEFIYFIFAPTFLYRHTYPRSDKVRPIKLIFLLTELICAALFFNVLIDELREKYFLFGFQHETSFSISHKILDTFFVANIITVVFIYLTTHLWTNILSEIMRFADKHFYEEWWDTSSTEPFFKRCFLPIYQYFESYIYNDLVSVIFPGYQLLSATSAIFISFFTLQYLVAATLGYFFPLISLFGIVYYIVLLFGINKYFKGIIFIAIFIATIGIIVSIHAIEYYAKRNCPFHNQYYTDYFQLKSFSCHDTFYHVHF